MQGFDSSSLARIGKTSVLPVCTRRATLFFFAHTQVRKEDRIVAEHFLVDKETFLFTLVSNSHGLAYHRQVTPLKTHEQQENLSATGRPNRNEKHLWIFWPGNE